MRSDRQRIAPRLASDGGSKGVFFGTGTSGYGDQFLADQAESFRPHVIVTLRRGEVSTASTHRLSVGNTNRVVASLDSRISRRLQQHNLSVGPGIAPTIRLTRVLNQASFVYTLFANDAIKLLPAFGLSTRRPPLIVNCGGGDVTTAISKGPAYVSALRTVFNLSAQIFAGSNYIRDVAVSIGAPPEKIKTHYLGVEVPAVAPVDRPDGPIRCLAVARLVEVKGPLLTLRAFVKAFGPSDNAHLTIVGDGPLRAELLNEILLCGRQHQVALVGELTRQQVFTTMSASHIFLQHNVITRDGQEEALGGSILEASARGLPVVATDSGGVSEAVQDGTTGFLVAPGDIAAMADRISQLADDSETRHRMGRAGFGFVELFHNRSTQQTVLGSCLSDLAQPLL